MPAEKDFLGRDGDRSQCPKTNPPPSAGSGDGRTERDGDRGKMKVPIGSSQLIATAQINQEVFWMKVVSRGLLFVYQELEQATTWLTASEIYEVTQLSKAQTCRCLRFLVEEGLAEETVIYPTHLYRLTKNPPGDSAIVDALTRVSLLLKK